MKIFIVGIVASGKTTLAKKLSEKYHIPWYEGDCIAHREEEKGRYRRTGQEQLEVITEINKQRDWIIEGTPRKSQEILFDISDKIIFLDPPLRLRYLRILTRFIKQKLGIEKCHYKSDIKMLKAMYRWTSDFEKNRAAFEARLKQYGGKVLWLKSGNNINRITIT